ncbi:MAG: AEC family transporter [Alphaproteobacteria bacterium]|jgi:malate permease and related proteins|nr:AEC family transporter [Alphaproteobacteria bacterium]MBT7944388.1 AEC family transporter [Alphaproteobacteria bacterium]
MFSQLFSVIAPVFICAAIGYVWKRQNRPFDADLITALSVNIGTPCLAFYTLTSTNLEPDSFNRMAAATGVTMIAFVVLYVPVLKVAGLSQRAFLPALTFGNVGNMGLPLCLLAFGEQGLALAISYFAINVIVMFSFGVAVAAGAASWRQLARLPVIYAILGALVFLYTGATPPDWVSSTTRLLGGLTIPLMLITLGVSLAGLGIQSLPRSLGLSVLRLLSGFAIGWATAEGFGMEGAARGVLIIQCAMPVAVFNYLFALRYNNQPEEVAGTVLLSTALSFLTLPALLLFVM